MNLTCPRRRRPRRAALLAVAAAVVLAGCGSVDGLDAGEPAPSVSVQPRPEPLWPAWSSTSSEAPGADAATHQPPPEPLAGLPKLGKDGLGAEDFRKVLRADPRMKPLADRGEIDRPGRVGLRPPLLTDLTGDGRPELLVAADTESGRSVLVAYTEREGRVYPILLTAGKRVSVETLGRDLLVRSPCTDGGEQAVRFHWDGVRMSTVSDVKNYKKTPGSSEGPPSPKPTQEPSGGTEPSGSTEPSGGTGGQR
ncbi:hypothetical protein [Streptomyces sp. NPDC055243]|uniref:hypothetical protein n=1 Tax=Streptomyces sp. NPDC055243 TaxID=3365720 RepID=UPI0037D58AFB